MIALCRKRRRETEGKRQNGEKWEKRDGTKRSWKLLGIISHHMACSILYPQFRRRHAPGSVRSVFRSAPVLFIFLNLLQPKTVRSLLKPSENRSKTIRKLSNNHPKPIQKLSESWGLELFEILLFEVAGMKSFEIEKMFSSIRRRYCFCFSSLKNFTPCPPNWSISKNFRPPQKSDQNKQKGTKIKKMHPKH